MANTPDIRKHLEQNMLDGDEVQGGQMLSSEDVLEYLEKYYLPKAQVEAAIGEPLTDRELESADIPAIARSSFQRRLRQKLGLKKG